MSSADDRLAREVDRLLKQLPGADPMLKGEPEIRETPSARPPGSPPSPRPRPPEPSDLAQSVSVWLRTLLAGGLGIAVTWWPYSRDCGWMLDTYFGVIGTVMLSGAWASVWAWRLRRALPHVVALIVVFWGIVLSAEQILPRIGYAAEGAAWECTGR